MRMKLWQSKDGWRVSLVWRNGRIFATTEAYSDWHEAATAAVNARRILVSGADLHISSPKHRVQLKRMLLASLMGVEYGIAELTRREAAAPAVSGASHPPTEARRRGTQKLELPRRELIQRAFASATLTGEQRNSIVEAAERATCLEDLERILWP